MHGIRPRLLPLLFLAAATLVQAQTPVTTPRQQFGHEIGADYVLPTYTQLSAYWAKLAAESERMTLDTIGRTAEGRPQLMAIISSPANHARLDRYREIARRLALAEGVDEGAARRLAAEGRAVVWIDGGLHATEVLGAQQLLETVYQLVSRDDAEIRRILDNVIVLVVQANPDGMELVSNWYMREPDSLKRSTGGVPRLYQKYVGHDNNRDSYASTQPETENMNRVMYREWFPQVMYNHHQSGPAGTVMFAPPFRDPFNFNFDPLIPVGIDLVAAAMHNRFIAEGKAGVTMRSGASYSTWWNGGLRTTAYFHNMIGLLTESIGNPTPQEIPFVVSRQLPKADLPSPIEPQRWHFRQSIDYSVSANLAVLDIAARYKDQFLFNIWRMGMNSIERGSRDSWTVHPRRILAAEQELAASRPAVSAGEGFRGAGSAQSGTRADFERLLRDPAARDPRGFILPADQPDFLTAAKFVDALLENGIVVQRATRAFQVNGKTYPAGSFVVKTAQAFRPHILDMFEPQDHPDDIPYPGAAPTPPYDNAGWTLAYQMGIEFDRILDGFDGPLEPIEGVRAPRPAGAIAGRGGAGWLLSHQVNDGFIALNRLLAAGAEVYWLERPVKAERRTWPAGTFYIRNTSPAIAQVVGQAARELGLSFQATGSRPGGQHTRLKPARVALWDRYGGSMESGWTRWLLEQFEFPFRVVFPRELDAGDLNSRYDVIVLPDGSVPARESGGRGESGARGGGFGTPDSTGLPPELRSMLGSVSLAQTVPQLRQFLEQGGTIITVGTGTNLGAALGLPITNHLVEVQDGTERPLPRSRYYVPGSVLQARLDTTQQLVQGMPERADFFFDNSPVFRLGQEAAASGVRALGWFDSDAPLRSGWAWGQKYLKDGVALVAADVGRGHLYLLGPEVTFRAQPHGTFKLLFNGILYGSAEPSSIR